ncbi:MAG: hypothetical protein WBA51_11280 [Erythrobacter sp.]
MKIQKRKRAPRSSVRAHCPKCGTRVGFVAANLVGMGGHINCLECSSRLKKTSNSTFLLLACFTGVFFANQRLGYQSILFWVILASAFVLIAWDQYSRSEWELAA